MPKVKKPDEVAALAERLVAALAEFADRGPDVEPPTLGDLAEASGVARDDPQVLKAAGKAAFKDQADRAAGKLSPDSAIYPKGRKPTRAELAAIEAAKLAARLLRVLESQRDLGDGAYPTPFARLADLAGLKWASPAARKAIGHPSLVAKLVVAGAGKAPHPDAPVLLAPDAVAWSPAILRFAFTQSKKPAGRSKVVALAFTPDLLAKQVHADLRQSFAAQLAERLRREDLPAGYAWLPSEPPLIFQAGDVRPGEPFRVAGAEATAPASRDHHAPGATTAPEPVAEPAREEPTRDFAEAFRAAFDAIDHRNRGTNSVRLLDLRNELGDFDRHRFDAGLRQLRVAREFALDSHEGLHRPLTPEERAAGIAEQGSLLVYVSRR